jgi:hypothetical protein
MKLLDSDFRCGPKVIHMKGFLPSALLLSGALNEAEINRGFTLLRLGKRWR